MNNKYHTILQNKKFYNICNICQFFKSKKEFSSINRNIIGDILNIIRGKVLCQESC